MTAGADQAGNPSAIALAYQVRTTHRLDGYAKGPETLDWDMQPNPFREFEGAPRQLLPLSAESWTTSFTETRHPRAGRTAPLTAESLGALLQLSMGLAAWKEIGPDRWAVRCNPSSGNLHPTEAYVLTDRIDGLPDGVHHYVSRDHALEHRCRVSFAPSSEVPGARLWVGLTSIHWREAWKYGERAFRYCQLDLGHALAALSYAAGVLGWSVRLVESCGEKALSDLLGLARDADFDGVEREDPDALVEIVTGVGAEAREQRNGAPVPAGDAAWTGKANRIDRHPMYRWPVIDEVAKATELVTFTTDTTITDTMAVSAAPPRAGGSDRPAVPLILGRRSAQRFDSKYVMPAETFFTLMDALLVRPEAPWDLWSFAPRIHPILFVHRVEGLQSGVYALVRRPDARERLAHALAKDFQWAPVPGAPEHLPLFLLHPADARQVAKTLSCHQAIAADSAFSLGMLSEFKDVIDGNPWRYRQLQWEAGLIGQVLYLEAETLGLRGTGIGCFFDASVHELFGLQDPAFWSLYHFTVGRALDDTRISTEPPYGERS